MLRFSRKTRIEGNLRGLRINGGNNKGKVVPVLPLTEHHAMKAYWGSGSTHSLTSALDGGEWSASRYGRFIPKERALVPIV
jgi:hypothetical protein